MPLACDTEKQLGTHALYLGLRHSSDVWSLESFPLSLAIEECSPYKESIEKRADSSKKSCFEERSEECT